MWFYLHYLVFAPLLLLGLLWFAFPERHPVSHLASSFRALFACRGGRLLMGCYLFVVGTNLIEGLYDDRLSAALGWDFTAKVPSGEGAAV